MKDSVKSVIVLLAICLVASAILAAVNSFTAPLIEKSENEKVEKSLLVVMPDGKNFKKIETAPDGLADTVKEIYSENGGGYVFKLVTTGYSAGLTIMCGIDSNGKITGATCVSSGETLGNEKTYGELFLGADKGTVDSVDSVSGATKTTANYKKGSEGRTFRVRHSERSGKMKKNKLSIFLAGLLRENPVFVLVLGTCPTLATTKSVIGAVSMGLAATAVLICSNMAISAMRKIIPDKVRIPCYIVIIAAFVTVVSMLMNAFLPELYELLGIYLALIVVNCIILGRAEMFAREHTVGESALDGAGMGLGFTLALLVMSSIREIIGSGTWAGIKIPVISDYSIPILTMAPGGFLVFGILIAVVNKITKGKGIKKKDFGCEGCPSAAVCTHSSCDRKEKDNV